MSGLKLQAAEASPCHCTNTCVDTIQCPEALRHTMPRHTPQQTTARRARNALHTHHWTRVTRSCFDAVISARSTFFAACPALFFFTNIARSELRAHPLVVSLQKLPNGQHKKAELSGWSGPKRAEAAHTQVLSTCQFARTRPSAPAQQ